MPVHKVKGGYQWGKSGKVYPDEAGADRQAAAAYANGYKGKSLADLDAAISLSGAVLNRARHYLAPGEKPPAGKQVQEGSQGGKYWETGGAAGGGAPDDAPLKVGEMVRFKVPGINGPVGRGGRILQQLPDGRLEVKDQQGGYHKLDPKQVQVHRPAAQVLDERGYPKPKPAEPKAEFADAQREIDQPDEDWRQFDDPREELQHWQQMAKNLHARVQQMATMGKVPLAELIKVSAKRDQAQAHADEMSEQLESEAGKQPQPTKPVAKHGKEVQAALGDFKGKLAELESGKLQNPAEFVDAARQVAQAYEQQQKEAGDGDPKMQQARSAAERDKSILDRALELHTLWRDRYDYAKQKGVPGEELEAVKSRFEEAGKEVLSSRMRFNESAKALYQLENPQQRQPKPRQPAQPKQQVYHGPDKEREGKLEQKPKRQQPAAKQYISEPHRLKAKNKVVQEKTQQVYLAAYKEALAAGKPESQANKLAQQQSMEAMHKLGQQFDEQHPPIAYQHDPSFPRRVEQRQEDQPKPPRMNARQRLLTGRHQ